MKKFSAFILLLTLAFASCSKAEYQSRMLGNYLYIDDQGMVNYFTIVADGKSKSNFIMDFTSFYVTGKIMKGNKEEIQFSIPKQNIAGSADTYDAEGTLLIDEAQLLALGVSTPYLSATFTNTSNKSDSFVFEALKDE